MKQKELEKYLKQTSWYHGTTLEGWNEIQRIGIRADYNLGNELDFGYGFYLAPKYKQAESYILRNIPFMKGIPEYMKKPIVIEFDLCLDEIINEYNHKFFLHRDNEFADFVIRNRLNPKNKNHPYDFIIGVMSDANPIDLIKKYRLNIINYEDIKQELFKWNSMEQLSLHNQNICDKLKVKKVIFVDEGKEFEFDENGFRSL